MSNLPGLLLADKDDVVGAATPATTASTAAAGRRPRVSTSLRVAKSLIHDYEQEDKTIANALKKEELAHRDSLQKKIRHKASAKKIAESKPTVSAFSKFQKKKNMHLAATRRKILRQAQNQFAKAKNRVIVSSAWTHFGLPESTIKEVYHRFDGASNIDDSDGGMNVTELRLALKALGFVGGQRAVRDVMDKYDTSKRDGVLSYDEFHSACNYLYQTAQLRDKRIADMHKRVDHNITALAEKGNARLKTTCVRDPVGPWSMIWDGFQLFLLVYIAFSTPLTIGFGLCAVQTFSALWYWDFFIDIYFIFDLVLAFFTGYEDLNGFYVSDHRSIARTYLFGRSGRGFGWFWVDIVSAVPVEYIQLMLGYDTSTGDIRAVKLAKALKIARLVKLSRLSKTVQIYKRRAEEINGIVMVISTLVCGLLLLHVVTCFFFLAGTAEHSPDCMPTQVADDLFGGGCIRGWVVKKGWVNADIDHCINAEVSSESGAMGVLSRKPLAEMYATSFAESFTRSMTVDTLEEKMAMVVCEIVYSVIFGAIAGFMFSGISKMSVNKVEYSKKMSQIREYAHSRKLHKPLRARLMQYNEFLYENKTVFDEVAILSELPPRMRSEVVSEIYGEIICNSMFFFGIEHNREAITKICLELRPSAALADDDIFQEGEYGDEMYFLLSGEVIIVAEHNALQTGENSYSVTVRKIFMEFELGANTQANNLEFRSALHEADYQRPGQDKLNGSRSNFLQFRKQLEEVTGVFELESDGMLLVYVQRTSQASQEMARKQTADEIKETGVLLHQPWRLKWDPCGAGDEGCWELTNKLDKAEHTRPYLVGKAVGEGQRPTLPPLSQHRQWTWERVYPSAHGNTRRRGSVANVIRSDWEAPQGLVRVSCVELLETLDHGSFGELEMLNLGGGATPRTREATARAMTDCHLSSLSHDSYVRIKMQFPKEMKNNERYFETEATRKGLTRKKAIDPSATAQRRSKSSMRKTHSDAPHNNNHGLGTLSKSSSAPDPQLMTSAFEPISAHEADNALSTATAQLVDGFFGLVAGHPEAQQAELLNVVVHRARSALQGLSSSAATSRGQQPLGLGAITEESQARATPATGAVDTVHDCDYLDDAEKSIAAP